ncbi:hypothetical protein [Haloferula sargassicola]|uniref:Uncharacterized protein n=1 Tax=Haloferula sargassicola TaxID=490096 RepID=A0ABP9UNH9_9BACT
MKVWMCFVWVWIASVGVSFSQNAAPVEVVKSAEKAVQDLGSEIVNGHHQAAVDSMYPQWKARMAKRSGGMEKLEESLRGIGDLLARSGISVISVKTYGVPRSHEVWPGAGQDGATVYTKWLVLVPTVTRMRVLQEGHPKPILIDSYGYQVAISDKGSNNWKFINGSDVGVADLRLMFTSLPANIELPEVKREEVK